MQKIAVYCRVSTDEQAEQNISIPAQHSRITSYCHAKNWKVVDYYIDEGYSGKDLERPAMKKLINDAAHKKFDIVAVWKLDRISRRQQHVLYLIEDVFNTYNVGFSSVTENIDTSTPAGRAMIGVLAVFAQLERETIVERSKFGKKEAAKQGRFGGGLPYGYDYNKDTKELVINPIQAEAVKLAFEYYLTGNHGFNSIAQMLTAKGFKGQRTNHMQKDQVKNILSSPFVAGYIKHLDSIYPGKHPAIIDKAVWDTVQDIMHKRYVPIPVKDEINLLTGIIYCGECGSRMRFKSRQWTSKNTTGTNYYYVCYGRAGFKAMSKGYCPSPFHHAEEINRKTAAQLKEYSINLQEIDEVINTLQPANVDINLQALKSEIAAIDTQMERWLNAYEQGAINAITLSDRTKKLTERKAKIENTLQEFAAQEKAHNDRIVNAAAVLEELQQVPEMWDTLTTEERRGLIANIVDKVTVYANGEVSVKLDI
jgi:site-specific DNA recombinase